ncbi:transcriptional repressor [Thermodesulfovibrionales bacterium]|nr:transcriptional repressor [Thermodesulfovibrionales bacterium]
MLKELIVADTNTKYRTTKQRKVILEELRKVDTHPTADEIYGMARKSIPRISIGTIYRNLEHLASQGLILKLAIEGGPNRFDGRVQNHYHIRCICCGKVKDVTLESHQKIERIAKNRSDYDIVGHTLEFRGICPKCKESTCS